MDVVSRLNTGFVSVLLLNVFIFMTCSLLVPCCIR